MSGCLADSFVLMLDDYDREGEQATARAIEEVLSANNIEYATGVLRGVKDCYMLTSKDARFLCSI